MVDIIKFLPYAPISLPFDLRYKPPTQRIIELAFLPTIKNISSNDRTQGIQTKRWTGRCPCDPPRLLDAYSSPYTLHRKLMNQELVRQGPTTTVDMSAFRKNKPRNVDKDTAKATNEVKATNLTSQSSYSGVDAQSSRLFDTLSKHVTIKPVPLRSTNSLVNNSTNTLTSWQKYWTSTHVQRRRKEIDDSEPFFYRPKCEQVIPGQTHFVLLRDSPYPNSDHNSNTRTPCTPPSSCSPTKLSNFGTPDQETLITKDDDSNQVSSIEFISSYIENSSSVMTSKASTIIPSKSIHNEDLIDTSLLLSSSSHLKSDSQIIEEVADAQKQLIPMATKLYKLPLPSDKTKRKKSGSKKRIRSKSTDKKEKRTRSASASKRKHQTATTTKQNSSTKAKETTPQSKYSFDKWDEPYVGPRFDPPTPRCSRTSFIYPEDSDTSLERSQLFEPESTIKGLESCVF